MDVIVTTTADGSFVKAEPTFNLATQEDFLQVSQIVEAKLPSAIQEAAVYAAQIQPSQE